MEEAAQSPIPRPIFSKERIEIIDILRGFAIFGILLVNVIFFYLPSTITLTDFEWPGLTNQVVERLVQFFAMGKFYTIFSFLFGFGLAIYLSRAEEKGINATPLFRRRLLILLLFGLIHGYLIWFGDILSSYVLVGFLLLLFRKRAQKTVLIWVIILFSVQMLLITTRYVVTEIRRNDPKVAQEMDENVQKQMKEFKVEADEAFRVYADGSYREVQELRTKDYTRALGWTPIFTSQFLALFLLGLYAGRRKIFHNVEENRELLKKVQRYGLMIGVPGNLIFLYANEATNPLMPSLLWTIGNVFYCFSVPALSFFYISTLTLVVHDSELWRRRLSPLAAVGRMALTNYLLQSVICTTIFYSHGLGLYGKVGPAIQLVMCIVIYLAQIQFSLWWMKHYEFGPAEWLWRSLTYGRRQPMRRHIADVTPVPAFAGETSAPRLHLDN